LAEMKEILFYKSRNLIKTPLPQTPFPQSALQ
jgi:hypothetical protein